MLTDKDIIKALDEYEVVCDDCACNDGFITGKKIMLNALDLINRQQAEIERLQNLECFKKIIFRRMHTNYKTGLSWEFTTEEAYNEAFEKEVEKLYDIATATVEAYKEFAERLKNSDDFYDCIRAIGNVDKIDCVINIIDNLVKELTEGKEK